MKKFRAEDIYGQIAKEYADCTGEKLRLESQKIQPPSDEMIKRLDYRIARQIYTLKARRFIRLAGALAAACLLLIVAVPFVDQLKKVGDGDSATESSGTQIIPLSFALPDNFTVTDSKVDDGVSIYYFSDSFDDNVVLQMEYIDPAEADFAFLKPIRIEGSQAYGISTGSFKILKFVHDGILYTLTCKHDINTLIAVSKNIF